MQNMFHTQDNQLHRDLGWRLMLIGVMALLMCSCQATGKARSLSPMQSSRPTIRLQELLEQESEPVVVSISSEAVVADRPHVVQQVSYQQPTSRKPSSPPPSPGLPRSACVFENTEI